MDVLQGMLDNASVLLEARVVFTMLTGILAGILAGALPGLTATMSMALLVPFTFSMQNDAEAVFLLLGIYIGTMHGGAISAILIRTPGTPAAACTVYDGYPLAQRGEASRALNISTVASTFGGVVSTVLLVLVAPQIAEFGLRFWGLPMFCLAMFGLSVVASVSEGSAFKGIIMAMVGLFISTVGEDLISGLARFDFAAPGLVARPAGARLEEFYWPVIDFGGRLYLRSGIPFIPLMIGLFAVTETLVQADAAVHGRRRAPPGRSGEKSAPTRGGFPARAWSATSAALKRMAMFISWADFRRILPSMSLSSILGTFVGAVPGTGGDIAGFVSYDAAKKISKNRAEFGKGAVEGLAASETANNAVTGGAMIPMLALGIPGDAVTAILLGALRERHLKPGPDFLTAAPGREYELAIVYTVFVGLLVANIVVMPLRLALTPLFSKAITVPRHFLWPAVAVFSLVGAYAMGNSMYSVDVMLVFGVFGYFCRKFGFPTGPLILGVILGPLAEQNLARAVQKSGGDAEGLLGALMTDPLSLTLVGLSLASLFFPVLRGGLGRLRKKQGG